MADELETDEVAELESGEALGDWRSAEYGRRRYRRWQINEHARARNSGSDHACLVRDISPGGSRIEFDGSTALAVNDRVILELEGYYPLLCEVRSNLDGSLGLAFLHDVQGQQSLANWLTLKEYGRRRDRRKNIETEARIHRDELELACITQNVSLGGAKAKLEEAAELALGAAVAFEIQGLMPIPAHIRRKIQDTVSVRFDHSPATQNALRDWLQQVPF